MSKKRASKKPGTKKRDYKAEYARRLERAAKLGYSKSVARGHAKNDTFGIREAKRVGRIPGAKKRVGPARTDAEKFIDRLRRGGFVNPLHEARRRWLLNHVEEANDLRKKILARLVTTQEDFVTVAIEAGHSEREAYTAWFSPK